MLHADNHLLAVVKPACLPVVPDDSGDPSLLELAKAWVKREYAKPGEVFLGVVHRLDRPVSGVVLFARTSKAAARLSEQFRDGRTEKRYLAVVEAAPSVPRGVVEQWLIKNPRTTTVRAVRPDTEGARRAITRWRTLGKAASGAVALEVEPVTGRPHQIRSALASQGAVIVGDVKYGAERPLDDRSIALHAASLAVEHPTTKAHHRFEAAPPERPWWRFD